MTVRAEQRPCPNCGTAFTWTPASPRQRFCSQRCRLSWWGARRRRATAALNRGGPPPPPGDAHADSRHADGEHDTPRDAAPGHDGTLAAVPACPHCRKPVAIVAWLVPPAAASVATPPRPTSPRHADTVRDSQ